jgi:NAD(P)-dependent dehydrogenase (short-subunit alcohol dehydrogenase family)
MEGRRWSWRRAFVTGGASGIGLRVAEELAAAGAELAILDQRLSDAARARIESARASEDQRILFVRADMTDAPALRQAVASAVAEIGSPDLAVHSAGINIAKMFHLLGDEEYRRVIDVNLWGSRNFAHAVLGSMRPGSHLVFISSFAGIAPNWSYGAYSASKFGVVGLAGVLRLESKPRGIGVSVVCPPNVPTPMSEEENTGMHPVQQALKETAGTQSAERVARIILSGARRRKFLILPGLKAKLTYLLVKLAPLWLVHRISDRIVRRVLREHPNQAPDWSEAPEKPD